MTRQRQGHPPFALLTTLSVALAGLSLGLAAQGRPPSTTGAPTTTPPQTGVILGRVIDGDSGRPVSGAMVILGGGPRPAAAAAATADLQVAQQLALAGALRGAGPGLPTPVMTTAEGQFVFRELGRGTYNISVQANGYTSGVYGRRRPDGPPRGLDLAQDERLTDVVVRVWKYAVIGGTVTDETGEPVVGAIVHPLRRMPALGAEWRLQRGPTAATDDRGMYRIAALVPGDYVISIPSTITTMPVSAIEEQRARSNDPAEVSRTIRERLENSSPALSTSEGMRVGEHSVQQAGVMRGPSADVRANGRVAVYPTTFHPAATTVPAATVVRLTSGEERNGVDLQIRLAAGVRVSGAATTPDGPAKNVGVRLLPAATDLSDTNGFETASTMTDSSGHFTLLGVTPGAYLVQMSRIPRPETAPGGRGMTLLNGVPVAESARGATAASPSFWAEQPLSVGAEDVDGVSVVMRAGADVSGQIEFESTAPRPPAQRLQALTVSLTPSGGRMMTGGVAIARVDGEGRFRTIAYPPGRYWLNINAPGPEWSVKSIMVDGVNVIAQPIELTQAPIAGAVVTFTDRAAQINGTVQGDPAAIDGASIIIFPSDVQSWIDRGMSGRMMLSTTASKTGTFQARLPIAGEYLAAALSPETPVDTTGAFYAALARVATRVPVTEGGTQSVVLPVSRLR